MKIPEVHQTQTSVTTIPNVATPVQLRSDCNTKVIDRRKIQVINREIPFYPDPVCRPTPKQVKKPVPKIPGSISDIDPKLNVDFKDNSPFPQGVISETYQRYGSKNLKNWEVLLIQAGWCRNFYLSKLTLIKY